MRPGNKDFGTLHADRWFVDLGYYGSEINEDAYERVKIWIAIYTTPGKNGFLAAPTRSGAQEIHFFLHSHCKLL